MPENYEDYQKHTTGDIEACLESLGCQPILFVGSGISKRYVQTPNWLELLQWCADSFPAVGKDFAYFRQTYSSPIEISSIFAGLFKEWAWGEGKSQFPSELFTSEQDPEIYLKYIIATHLEELTKSRLASISDAQIRAEISSIKAITPHAIITTNYDRLLENIFDEYTPIVGQKILRTTIFSIGEIFKVHGCVSEPSSLVLTKKDYETFTAKKKYLSAKLLTFFAEHPLLIVGYSASDPNIKAILSDIDEILSEESELIPNIYFLQWVPDIQEKSYPRREHVIILSETRSIRVKCIEASDFSWVFKAFSSNKPIETIHPKLLRAVLARTYDMVRCDIPRKSIEVDYSTLERVATGDGEIAKLFGITLDDAKHVNAQYPYCLTQVAQQLGYKNWNPAQRLLEQLKQNTGRDIKASDNEYHVAIKVGTFQKSHKYSQKLVDLLKATSSNPARTA
jgi:hypothetical protein